MLSCSLRDGQGCTNQSLEKDKILQHSTLLKSIKSSDGESKERCWNCEIHVCFGCLEGRILSKIKDCVRDHQLQKNQDYLLTLTASDHQLLPQVKESWIYQPLDHFNRQDINTFPQRFFVNEAYWQCPDGPVFLFIGGEGPIHELDVLIGHHADMAKEHRALLLAVEHRFYGNSINQDGLKAENLAVLSSQQALVFALHQCVCVCVCISPLFSSV
ncbi:putative serine protease F56F10.1 [Nothobranchius furzeri]|uniref:Serine protease F56F10.1 n=1 Tax=Nothobranchius furzeri TaxID=105023 RepID=A0A9D2YFC6_NOTFU|nr:putative serine protease F56F10.1 [Nothobranchius furzeri]